MDGTGKNVKAKRKSVNSRMEIKTRLPAPQPQPLIARWRRRTAEKLWIELWADAGSGTRHYLPLKPLAMPAAMGTSNISC